MFEVKTRDMTWVEDLKEIGAPETLAQCFRCGACSGICPVEKVAEDFDPRVIVHSVLWGLKRNSLKGRRFGNAQDVVLASPSVRWMLSPWR